MNIKMEKLEDHAAAFISLGFDVKYDWHAYVLARLLSKKHPELILEADTEHYATPLLRNDMLKNIDRLKTSMSQTYNL